MRRMANGRVCLQAHCSRKLREYEIYFDLEAQRDNFLSFAAMRAMNDCNICKYENILLRISVKYTYIASVIFYPYLGLFFVVAYSSCCRPYDVFDIYDCVVANFAQ